MTKARAVAAVVAMTLMGACGSGDETSAATTILTAPNTTTTTQTTATTAPVLTVEDALEQARNEHPALEGLNLNVASQFAAGACTKRSEGATMDEVRSEIAAVLATTSLPGGAFDGVRDFLDAAMPVLCPEFAA